MDSGGTLITRDGADVRWWTWAGYRANATLTSTLLSVTDPVQRPTDLSVRLREGVTAAAWAKSRESVRSNGPLVLPDVDPRAVRGLKFSAVLPERLAMATVTAMPRCGSRRRHRGTGPRRHAGRLGRSPLGGNGGSGNRRRRVGAGPTPAAAPAGTKAERGEERSRSPRRPRRGGKARGTSGSRPRRAVRGRWREPLGIRFLPKRRYEPPRLCEDLLVWPPRLTTSRCRIPLWISPSSYPSTAYRNVRGSTEHRSSARTSGPFGRRLPGFPWPEVDNQWGWCGGERKLRYDARS